MSLAAGGHPPLTPEFLAQDARTGPRIGIIVVNSVAIPVLLLRVYARCFLIKCFGWDDGLMCVAGVLMVAVMVMCLKIIDLGCGLHIWAIPPLTLVSMFKHLYALQLIYTIALWFCRISGLAFYSRLCKDVTRFRMHMWVASIFVTAVFISQFLILLLQCIPIKALWHDGPGKCMTTRASFISTAAMTITCDSVILLIPIRIIWDLKMNRRRKILLAFTLLVGVFAVVTSVFRVLSMLPAVREADATWYYATIAAWTSTEVATAVIALSVPALKPLLGHWLRTDTTVDSKGYSNVDTTGGSKNASYGLKSFRPPKPSGTGRGGRSSEQSLSEENLWANGQVQVHNNIHGNTASGDQDDFNGIIKTVEVHVKDNFADSESRNRVNPSSGL